MGWASLTGRRLTLQIYLDNPRPNVSGRIWCKNVDFDRSSASRRRQRRRLVNKTELIESVAKQTGETKRVVGDVVEGLVGTIQKQVKKGDKVTLPGFGTFSRRQRAARQARNPQTGEAIKVKASKVPAFKPGTGFKNYVSGSRKKT
jgi:DNA-binding protein HU-beta